MLNFNKFEVIFDLSPELYISLVCFIENVLMLARINNHYILIQIECNAKQLR